MQAGKKMQVGMSMPGYDKSITDFFFFKACNCVSLCTGDQKGLTGTSPIHSPGGGSNETCIETSCLWRWHGFSPLAVLTAPGRGDGTWSEYRPHFWDCSLYSL